MIRARRTALVATILAVVLATAGGAYARTETLKWTHPDPAGVDNFRVYWGVESGFYPNHLDVGIPGTDLDGNYVYVLEVPEVDGIFVVMTAARAGLESLQSNEEYFAATATDTPVEPDTSVGRPGKPFVVLP